MSTENQDKLGNVSAMHEKLVFIWSRINNRKGVKSKFFLNVLIYLLLLICFSSFSCFCRYLFQHFIHVLYNLLLASVAQYVKTVLKWSSQLFQQQCSVKIEVALNNLYSFFSYTVFSEMIMEYLHCC